MTAIVCAAAAVPAACGRRGAVEPPDGAPVVRGPVGSILEAARAWRVHVRPTRGRGDPCGMVASATSNTRVLRRTAAGGVRRASLREVAVGDTVEVYAEVVLDSCPAQGVAAALVLEPGAGGTP